MDSLCSTRVFTAPVATATTGTKWSRIAVPWTRLLFSTSRALPPRRCWLLGMGSAPHHDRLGHMGPRGISRLNAIVLGEALAAEENDLVFPSHDFSRHAHISSPEQVALYWEGNEPGQDAQQLTYAQMLEKVCQGVLHTNGGYMVYTATTFKYAFDYKPSDVYWYSSMYFCGYAYCRVPLCTADCGWITGHSYVTYGPLLNGATVLVFEGYKVTILYTAPTLVRALMRDGDEITPIPGAWPQKPGSATFPFFGIQVKGQGIYAYVTLVDGIPYSEEVRKSLILAVRNQVRLGRSTASASELGSGRDSQLGSGGVPDVTPLMVKLV
ncbi:hypothetical protein BHM03_00041259 [Ensete ventricosum]|nr:hypothetical protein BHM03_00041259 [Ensete ventricosum]